MLLDQLIAPISCQQTESLDKVKGTFSSLPSSSVSPALRGTLLGVEERLAASASLSCQSNKRCLPFFKVHFLPNKRRVLPPTGAALEAAGGPLLSYTVKVICALIGKSLYLTGRVIVSFHLSWYSACVCNLARRGGLTDKST